MIPTDTLDMSSFFTTPASQRKRKRGDNAGPAPAARKRNAASKTTGQVKKSRRDDSISGSDSAEDDNVSADAGASEFSGSDTSDAADETEAERRLKLAERYLENVRADVDAEKEAVGFDAEDVDKDLIAARLKEDVAEEKGRLYRRIAGQLDFAGATRRWCDADTASVTGVACCPPYLYTVSKQDMAVVKWEVLVPPRNQEATSREEDGDNEGLPKRPQQKSKPKKLLFTRGNTKYRKDLSFRRHTAPILCVAASADGRFVVSGGADRKLIVWDPETLKPLKVFTQHRDAVTSLAFRGKTNQLFSASKDRTVKIWSLNELGYVETLFGHQDEVVDVAAVGGPQERCVSVGARDRTARLWKVVEESQLVFRGGGTGGAGKKSSNKSADEIAIVKGDNPENMLQNFDAPTQKYLEGSLDRVIQVDSHLFVTGSDSGALSLYGLHKKKPLDVYRLAHGVDPALPVEQSSAEANVDDAKTQGQPTARWITALASVPYSDLFLSGSWDGYVRAWRISDDQKTIEKAGVVGQVEAIADGAFVGDGMRGIGAEDPARIRGFVNDLAVFERGERGKDGLCVVAGVGDETRLGRWMTRKARTGAIVFEVPRLAPNGVAQQSEPVTNGV